MPAATVVVAVALIGIGILNVNLKSTDSSAKAAADSATELVDGEREGAGPGGTEEAAETPGALSGDAGACNEDTRPATPEEWENAFAGMPAWRAADQGSSVLLPGGDVLWLFNDTIAETSDGPGLLRNSVVVTRGSCPVFDSTESADEFIAGDDEGWWWPTHAVVEGDAALVLAGKYSGGTHAWDFTHTADSLFKIVQDDASGVRVVESFAIPGGTSVNWSAGLAKVDDYLVVFGTDEYHRLRVARTLLGQPGASWEYALGEGAWTTDAAQAWVGPYVGSTSVSALYDGETWSLLSKPGGLLGSSIVELTSASVQGPYTTTVLMTLENTPGSPWTYNPVRHSWADGADGKALLSVSRNIANIDDVYANYTLYRPKFYLVDVP